jgi:hypothetical protein
MTHRHKWDQVDNAPGPFWVTSGWRCTICGRLRTRRRLSLLGWSMVLSLSSPLVSVAVNLYIAWTYRGWRPEFLRGMFP